MTILQEELRKLILLSPKGKGQYSYGIDPNNLINAIESVGFELEAHQNGIYGTMLLLVEKPQTNSK